MKRRQFIALLGGATAWPLAGHAQQRPALVGFLHNAPSKGLGHIVDAVRRGIEASTPKAPPVTIEARWADGRYDRLPALAEELVRLKPAVIVAGGHGAALAAKAATKTIPIVFITGGDPVRDGLVETISRPGGNATGVSVFLGALGPKRLAMMRELLPNAGLIALLKNSGNPIEAEIPELETAAQAIGQKLLVLDAPTPEAINAAFATLVQQRADAFLITADASFNGRRDQLIALAARHKVPGMYYAREFVASGGLISYGTDFADVYRQVVGEYVARILQGSKPADLPVQHPLKFRLWINLATAKALGITVPRVMLARADEVIE